MSRAYMIYFLMFATAVAGLWVILTIGAAMKAPDDLSGEWTVAWEGPPPMELKGATMRVEQSGRYFVVRFGQREPISFTLRAPWKGAWDGRQLQMELDGKTWDMSLSGDIPLGESLRVRQLHMELRGTTQHTGTAQRVGMDATTRPAGVARAR